MWGAFSAALAMAEVELPVCSDADAAVDAMQVFDACQAASITPWVVALAMLVDNHIALIGKRTLLAGLCHSSGSTQGAVKPPRFEVDSALDCIWVAVKILVLLLSGNGLIAAKSTWLEGFLCVLLWLSWPCIKVTAKYSTADCEWGCFLSKDSQTWL